MMEPLKGEIQVPREDNIAPRGAILSCVYQTMGSNINGTQILYEEKDGTPRQIVIGTA